MAKEGSFQPYVPASSNIPEVTAKAVILGSLLAIVLGAANAYLGLYAGMTVSASIPAAVLSMGILRGLLRSGTILENNIVQTIAASGEAIAAGVIFTIPAMLIAGVWTDIQFWPTTLICLCGGLLGICFMIPLRKTLIVEQDLTYPEGLACAEVLKAGEAGGSGAKYILWSMLFGSAFKFLVSGYTAIKGTVEWAWTMGGRPFYFGSDVSAALVGVGYIVGWNVATLLFVGGAIGWIIAVPFVLGLPAGSEDLVGAFWGVWSTKIRYLGVGAMITGGVWSIISLRTSIAAGFREAVLGYKVGDNKSTIRTERNMAQKHIAMLMLTITALTFGLYYYLIQNIGITIVATVSMIVMSFFFVAVASYIVGLVGSSNSPVSGMVICAVLGTAMLLLLFGLTGEKAIIATLGVAGVVCCAAASAGDISQDLKTGYLIGATPRNQQWMEVLGTVIPAFVMAPTLTVLHHAYGIGTGQPGALKAPQANLFASLTKGIFGQGELPWNLVMVGAAIGVAIILADQALKARKSTYRMPVMAVAIGLYLPFTLSAPMLLGGIIAKWVSEPSETGKGTLVASGLIAGEAIMGVILGGIIYMNKDALPIKALSSDPVSVAALLAVGALLVFVSRKK